MGAAPAFLAAFLTIFQPFQGAHPDVWVKQKVKGSADKGSWMTKIPKDSGSNCAVRLAADNSIQIMAMVWTDGIMVDRQIQTIWPDIASRGGDLFDRVCADQLSGDGLARKIRKRLRSVYGR